MVDLRIGVITELLCYLVLGSVATSADEAYKLGPEDQVQVKITDLRAGTGQAYQWMAFTDSKFVVGPSGQLSLPVLGELEASGKTTSELEVEIANKLQAKAGLAVKPDASVQIVNFRPFYVMGSVDKPGEYEYRPGLTVLQAVSLAGGMQRVAMDALLGYAREALNSRGDLRVLSADRTAFLVRQARLEAEISGSTAISMPEEVRVRAEQPDVSRILREEQLLFESRRDGLQTQIVTLNQNKDFLQREIEQLTAKDVAITSQLDATRKELGQITSLVSKGFSPLPRQLELEQNVAQIESNRLDIQLAIVRAREDISNSDRDISQLKTTRRNDELQELSETRLKLAETTEKIATVQATIMQDEARAPMTIAADKAAYDKPDYFLARRIDGKVETIRAQEDDLVQPSDVVRVVPKSLSNAGDSLGAAVAGHDLSHGPSAF
jgi:protein involved in polysaccharide export with SLBB domain